MADRPGPIRDDDAIAEFLAAHGATTRPNRAGAPRKAGARHPNGRLVWSPPANDKGHNLTLAHRAAIIAGADPTNPLASECLGILYLRGDLADPGLEHDAAAEQGYLRYLAGIKYGRDHAVVWRSFPGRPNPSARSHLGFILASDRQPIADFDADDEDPDKNYRERSRALRSATARLLVFGPYPLYVFDDIVVHRKRMRFMDEDRDPFYLLDAERATIAALRLALGALVVEYHFEPRRPGSR